MSLNQNRNVYKDLASICPILSESHGQWDTLPDMALALIGAISAVVLLSKWHDKALTQLGEPAELHLD